MDNNSLLVICNSPHLLRLPKEDFSGTIASLRIEGLDYEKNMESKKTQKNKKTWLYEENGYSWW